MHKFDWSISIAKRSGILQKNYLESKHFLSLQCSTEKCRKNFNVCPFLLQKRSPMENRAAFISFWQKNCPETPLPEMEFFDSAEDLQDRFDLCKHNLKEALCTLEKEGLIFRFLSKVLNSNDYDDFKGEVCGILRRLFSDSLSCDYSDNETHELHELSTVCEPTDRKSNRDPVTNEDEHFLIRGSSFAFSVESNKQQQNHTLISGVQDTSESEPFCPGGSELQAVDEQQLHLPGAQFPNSTTQPSADRDVELLNNQNDKVFLSGQNLPSDEGTRELVANEDGAVRNTSNQKVLITARDSCRMDQTEVKTTAINTKGTFQDNGNSPLNTVCGPFKSATLPANTERTCKWQSEGRPYSCESCQFPDITIPYETKTNERRGNKGVTEPSDIGLKTSDSPGTKRDNTMSRLDTDSSTQAKEDEDILSNSSEERPTLAEEETFLVDSLSEGKDDLEQETIVVDDLISYLEGIELENSSEGEDSAASEGSGQMAYGFQGKNGTALRKKQLQSALSTASGISVDSCLSPYALDVAMSEIHSAESSDQDEAVTESPSLIGENNLTVPKRGDAAPTKPKPPAKPPRRRSKKGLVRAHTVGTPVEIKTKSRGYSEEDEVFSKEEEEGYEGDQESQALSQSHSSLSTAKVANSVQFRTLLATGEEDRRKLRRSRGSNVILDQDNIDFPSSPLSSPVNSAKDIVSSEVNKDDAHKLQNRKWVASAVVDSEKGYLECLNILCKYMKPIKASLATTVPILSTHDFNKIFFKIEELFKMHEKFYHDLEIRVSNWNIRQIIGDLFLSLVYQFEVYREYMQNYKIAIDTIQKCKSNEQFSQIFSKEIKLTCSEEKTSLESLFSKPVDRMGRYVTAISDLLKQTPKEHPDYGILLEVQVVTQEFLGRVSSGDQKDGAHLPRVKRDHRLIKDGFLVELTDGIRKFRHLFLFNDVLLCTKRKVTARHEQYVCKWYLPLADLVFHPHDSSEPTQMVPVASESDIDLLKGRIVSLKSEIRKEQGTTGQGSGPDDSPATKRKRAQSTNKTIEKLKKKLAQQEAALLLVTPSLPFHLYSKNSSKTYTLLCKSDKERADWKENILCRIKSSTETPSGLHLSLFELQSLLEACKKLRTCKTLGKVSIVEDKELLNGLLYVDIQNGKGFHRSDLYCVIEVDHYGQFVRKAKTKICKSTGDPVWNQDFDIEVEGSKELRLHVFGKSRYGLMSDEECGLGKITLTRENLTDQKKRNITISLDKQGAVTLSIQYSKTLQGIQRKKSVSDAGVFCVDIDVVTSREEFDIPLIIIGCVQEVEKRGTEEIGIYRLSGASSDVRRLKEAFNENSQSALVSIAETDIHAVSGLLKLYLRELPEPLFTNELYNEFVEAYGLSDKDEKKERMLELLNSLPTPNRLTALYLFQHLRKVGGRSDVNKMSLNNLATIFGPNVLRPSTTSSSPMDLAQGTLDVMSQVGIFLYFLKLDCDDVRLPNDPEIQKRLDPTGSTDNVDYGDRLI